MNYKIDVVEAMAKAHRECWRDREKVRQDTLDWDEICGAEFLDSIAYAEASLAALVNAHPEVAQYVMEAPPAEKGVKALNNMRSIPEMITGLRALANSPEALISHAALLDDAANYIEGATGSLREHMQMLTKMRVRLEQVRPLMGEAAKELEELYDIYRANQHQYEREMELPRAIRSMLRWWEPGE